MLIQHESWFRGEEIRCITLQPVAHKTWMETSINPFAGKDRFDDNCIIVCPSTFTFPGHQSRISAGPRRADSTYIFTEKAKHLIDAKEGPVWVGTPCLRSSFFHAQLSCLQDLLSHGIIGMANTRDRPIPFGKMGLTRVGCCSEECPKRTK